jgi:hypothetical protein
MPDIETAQDWRGCTMVDPAGAKVGTIDAIYLDDDKASPNGPRHHRPDRATATVTASMTTSRTSRSAVTPPGRPPTRT